MLPLVVTGLLSLAASQIAHAASTCSFTTIGNVQALKADCTTDETIFIPNGGTLDGRGHTITALDPLGSHLGAAILQNGGATANVRNVTLTAQGLADICDVGDAKLRGILLDGASGSIRHTNIVNVNKSGQGDCPKQGAAIFARNIAPGANPTRVVVTDTRITGFPKIGISAQGNVTGLIADNTIEGLGGVGLASDNQFGIALQQGARLEVSENSINLHGTSVAPFAFGATLFESDRNIFEENVIKGADYGIFLQAFCTSLPSTSRNSIEDNRIESRIEGITLVARGFIGNTCAAHVDRNHVEDNRITVPSGVIGLSGIVLIADVLGGTYVPTTDQNVIKENTIRGYTTPIYQRGDTNTVLKDNKLLP